jgi:hypothetical protein
VGFVPLICKRRPNVRHGLPAETRLRPRNRVATARSQCQQYWTRTWACWRSGPWKSKIFIYKDPSSLLFVKIKHHKRSSMFRLDILSRLQTVYKKSADLNHIKRRIVYWTNWDTIFVVVDELKHHFLCYEMKWSTIFVLLDELKQCFPTFMRPRPGK